MSEGQSLTEKDVGSLVEKKLLREWPTTEEEFDAMHLKPYSKGVDNKHKTLNGEEIDLQNSVLIVYSATTKDKIDTYLKDGIDPKNKATNPAREKHEAGEYAGFGPSKGLSSGIYVAPNPVETGLYANNRANTEGIPLERVVIAIKVNAGDISPPPEKKRSGVEDGLEALSKSDGVIKEIILPEDIKVISYGSESELNDAKRVIVENGELRKPPKRDFPKEVQPIIDRPYEEITQEEAKRLLMEGVGENMIKPFSSEWFWYSKKLDPDNNFEDYIEVVKVAREEDGR